MHRWGNKKDMAGDDPPYLSVGTEVSAKYKGAFCEAKIRKVVKAVKCKVQYKNEAGSAFVSDEQIKGVLMPGASVEVKQPDKKEYIEGTIIKIQDLSQYTVVFDDGDIATLRRTALCLKSGRHFAEGETLDQLPLTHPEHFSTPVVSGMRGSRRRDEMEDNSDDESKRERKIEREEDMGKVVCVEIGDKKKSKDNWFPGLIVAPNAQDSVKIDVEDEYLVRSFKDGRYYTVPKRETVEFTREVGAKVDHPTLKMAVEKAISFLDKDDLPPHWDREVLFGMTDFTSESDGSDTDSNDDEPREEKDHFVAQLYKFMDDRGTPINKGPMISSKDVDLYKLFKIVSKLGGYNRVTNRNQWKTVAIKLGYTGNQTNNVKTSYKKYLHNFEDFYRKLGCTMLSHNSTKLRNRSTRPLIRDRDKSLLEKPEKEDSNSNVADEDLDEGKELPNGVKTKLESQTKDDADVVDDRSKTVEAKKENQKLKRELSVETSKDEDTKKKSAKSEISAAPVIKDPIQTTTPVTSKDTKAKPGKGGDDVKDEKANGVDNKSEKKTPKVAKVESNETAKKVDKTKNKNAKLKGVEKRIKKNDNALAGIRKRSLKDRMKAIVKKLKLKSTANDNEQDKKKQKNVEEANKASPQLFKLKSKEEILNNGAKTRKLSISNDVKNLISGNAASDRKSTSSSASGGNTSDGGNSASGTGKSKKNDDDNGDGPKKKTYTRKKKDEDKYSSTSSDSLINQSIDIVSPHKTICIGDKLKVYYGPTHESKVTYEAKVMNKRYGAVTEYLVHYTGWNTRYDEWIRRSRIAEDLSWTPARDKLKYNEIEPQSNTQTPSQADQPPQQNPNVVKSGTEKMKRSSISPVAKNRSKSVTKTGAGRGRAPKSKSPPSKFDVAKGKKASTSKADSESSDESETESNRKQELQKTRSRTERRKQQDEDTSSKDSDSKVRKPPPLKRTRSGSLKLESKEEPVKKRKVTPTKTPNKTSRAAAIRNSIMKNLVPRKRLAEKGKKLFKKKDQSCDKQAEDIDKAKETANAMDVVEEQNVSDDEKSPESEMSVKSENLHEVEKQECEETELVLKIKPFPSPGAVVHEVEDDVQVDKLEPIETKEKGVNVSVDSDDAGPPVLKKEISSDDDASAPNTSPFLADSYLAENLDKPKLTKAKTKKEAEEKSPTAAPKLFNRSTPCGADKSPAKTAAEVKEKTFFTSRIDKSETKKIDTVEKDKKDIKIRNVTSFNSYLNMDKIDSIRKNAQTEKSPVSEKSAEKSSPSGKSGCEDDIYEFKEPEPFEFRGIDDRTILHRRPPSRIFEDASFKRTNKASPSPGDGKDDDCDKTTDEMDDSKIIAEDVDRDDEVKSKEKDADGKPPADTSKDEKIETPAKKKKDLSTETKNEPPESTEPDEATSKTEPETPEDDVKSNIASTQMGDSLLIKIDDAIKSSLYSLENEDEDDDEDMDDAKLIISETEQLAGAVTLTESITDKIIGGTIDEVSVAFAEFDDDDDKAPELEPVSVELKESPNDETKKLKPPVIEPAIKSPKSEEKSDVSPAEKQDEAEKLRADETLDSDDESVYSTKSSASSGNKDLAKVSPESNSIEDDVDDEYLSSDSTSAISQHHLAVKKQENAVKTYSSDSAHSAKKKTVSETKNDPEKAKPEETPDAKTVAEKMDTEDTVLSQPSIIGEVEIEINVETKDTNEGEKETDMETEMAEKEDISKTKDEDDNDGLLLCEETIPKSPETKDTTHQNDNELSYPGGSGINNDAKKVPDKSPKPKRGPRPNAFPAPATVFENTPPTTPEGSTPGNSPSDERNGFSSTNFSLNEKCALNKDSSENDTYSDNSEKSLKSKKYRDESGTYGKKNSYDYDSYVKRKAEKDTFYKNEEPTKKKPKQYGPASANESEKDEYSDEGNSPKSTSSQKLSKSSYYMDLDPNLDANQRIEILEQKLQDLRKKYLSLKQELISIDKKRKKLRRKEREGRMMTRNEANSLL